MCSDIYAYTGYSMLSASGEAKIGFSDEYAGFKVTATGAVAQVDRSVILGTDEMNAYIKGEASFLSANGKAAMEVKKNGEYTIGFDGNAALAEANAHIGMSLLNYNYKESKDAEKETLFGIDLDPSVGVQAGGGLWAEKKHVYETDYFYLSSNNLKVSLSVLAGMKLNVTYPTIDMKPIWTW